MADYADARRRAEEDLLHVIEWLESGHWMACQPLFADDGAKAREKGQRLRALLAAGPEAPPPPSDAVREAAEVLDSLVNRVWSMLPEEAESAGLPTIAKVLRASKRLLSALAASPATVTVPDDAAVREAAEVIRTILTAHDARLSESGVLTYGPPSKGTGFVAAIQWLRRYDAARGGE